MKYKIDSSSAVRAFVFSRSSMMYGTSLANSALIAATTANYLLVENMRGSSYADGFKIDCPTGPSVIDAPMKSPTTCSAPAGGAWAAPLRA
jgi:hypothetical protein